MFTYRPALAAALLSCLASVGCSGGDATDTDTGFENVAGSGGDVGPDGGAGGSDGGDGGDGMPGGHGGGTGSEEYPLDDLLRINEIQTEGTHNSYHKWSPIPLLTYGHPPLDEQLSLYSVRQFELDVHWEGGSFSVFHSFADKPSTCTSLIECLTILKTWSNGNPGHQPLFVIIEPKDDLDISKIKKEHFSVMEDEVLSVWPRDLIVTPDDVRGVHPDLRTAITTDGWPTLGEARGKILFFMLNRTDDYLDGDPSAAGRLFFPRGEDGSEPYAGVFTVEEAQGKEDEIRRLVTEGFIVRTRYSGGDLIYSDARVEAALRGGAQWLSGDYEQDFSLPDGLPSRCNPVNAPPECFAEAIE